MTTQQPLDPVVITAGLRASAATWHPPIVRATTGSTNDDLRAFAEQTSVRGSWCLALADAQTEGRGRLGHRWFSPAGRAIHLSVATELRLPTELWPRASLVVGAAVADCIEAHTGVEVGIKWPNDLFVRFDGSWRKLGGILCERAESSQALPSPLHHRAVWIAGIGVDVSIERVAFAPDLRDAVASLQWLVKAELPSRSALACAIAVAVQNRVDAWQKSGGALDVAQIEERLVFIGDAVSLDLGDGRPPRDVRLLGLATDGGLRVEAIAGGDAYTVHPLQIVAARCDPPWQAPRRLERSDT